MANFTKAQILNFLDNQITISQKSSTPSDSSTRFLFLRLCRILVSKDIITAADINAAFVEWP